MRSLTGAEWNIRRRAPRELFEALDDLPPLTVQILHGRGHDTPEKVRAFLDGPLPPYDPYLLTGMDRAVSRIADAAARGQTVCVYGDYDVDGVTATVLLVEALGMLGCQAFPYIPERVREGYGMNLDAMAAIRSDGAELIVSADCGTNSEPEIERAVELGMDVVVTDHHHADRAVAGAVATLNPSLPESTYPFIGLAGVGVAYKLVHALAEELPDRLPYPEEFLDLVALGTVGDVAPLQDENRTFVSEGLAQLRQTHRVGLRALGEVAQRPVEQATAETIAFWYAPRLNAAGRLAHAQLALELVQAEHPVRAQELARQLDTLNAERRRLTDDVVADVTRGLDPELPMAFAVSDAYPAGIVGLAASRLSGSTGYPAFVATHVDGEVRGSARSPAGVHLTELLGRSADLLIAWGGHARAAGFRMRPSQVDALRDRLTGELGRPELVGQLGPRVHADGRVYPATINWDTFRQLSELGPFGEGHERPRFVVENVVMDEVRTVGSDHLAIRFAELGPNVEGIWFGCGDLRDALPRGRRVDAAFRLDVRTFRGTTRLQMLIDDIRLAAHP